MSRLPVPLRAFAAGGSALEGVELPAGNELARKALDELKGEPHRARRRGVSILETVGQLSKFPVEQAVAGAAVAASRARAYSATVVEFQRGALRLLAQGVGSRVGPAAAQLWDELRAVSRDPAEARSMGHAILQSLVSRAEDPAQAAVLAAGLAAVSPRMQGSTGQALLDKTFSMLRSGPEPRPAAVLGSSLSECAQTPGEAALIGMSLLEELQGEPEADACLRICRGQRYLTEGLARLQQECFANLVAGRRSGLGDPLYDQLGRRLEGASRYRMAMLLARSPQLDSAERLARFGGRLAAGISDHDAELVSEEVLKTLEVGPEQPASLVLELTDPQSDPRERLSMVAAAFLDRSDAEDCLRKVLTVVEQVGAGSPRVRSWLLENPLLAPHRPVLEQIQPYESAVPVLERLLGQVSARGQVEGLAAALDGPSGEITVNDDWVEIGDFQLALEG